MIDKAVNAAGFTPAGLAIVGAGVAAAWGAIGWWLGRRFESQAAASEKASGAVLQDSKV
jgi:AAA family ATP:ADP antiporter